MAEVGAIFVRIGAKIDEFEAGIKKVQDQISAVEKRFEGMQAVSERLTSAGQKLALTGGAMAAGFGLAVKTAADFDAQMSKVQALSGATTEDFQRLRDAAIELGAKSVYSASEAAEGMQILAAAGFDANQIVTAMPGLLNAAAAAGENFGVVADIMVAAMSGFGLQAQDMSHIADVLASAANASAISIADIGYSLKYIAPVAKTAGVSLEEVAAALAVLGNAGIKAEQAGTTLRMALIRLADPPREAAAMMSQLGINVTDASGKMLPFQQIIAQLHEKFSGLSQAQKLQAAATLFGAESMSGMLALIDAGPEQLGSLTNAFLNNSGAAQQMAETTTNNLAGAWEQLKGALESALITIGTALTPALQNIAQHLQSLITWFNSLPAPVQNFIAVAGALAAVLTLGGGIMLMFVGQIMQGIVAVKALGAALGVLPAVFAAISGPVGIAIAVITALAVAAYLIIKNWEPIKGFFAGLWDRVTSVFKWALSAIETAVGSVWERAKRVTSDVWNGVKRFFAEWWPELLSLFGGSLGQCVVYLVRHWNDIKAKTQAIWHEIREALEQTWSTIKNTASGLWREMTAEVTQAVRSVQVAVVSIWTDIKDWVTSIWKGMKSAASRIFDEIAEVITSPFRNIHIPMPHFSFWVSEVSVAGIRIPVPHVDVEWYARGGIFNQPSVIGVGESGPEAVLPLNDTSWMDTLASRIAAALGGAGSGDVYVYIGSEQVEAHICRFLDRKNVRSNGR